MAKLRRKSTPFSKTAPSKPKPTKAPVKGKSVSKPKAPVKVVRKPAPAAKPKPKAVAAPKAKPKAVAKVKPAPKALSPKAKVVVVPVPPPSAKPTMKPAVKVKVQAPPQPQPRRSTYVDAVALYERGVQFLQARQFKEAADTLQGVISQFPEEKELHERARLYLRICEQRISSAPQRPETADDRVYAATLSINNGALDQAITILSGVTQKDPEHDHATYMLGVALALKGQHEAALQQLARSMALNPENRDLAFKEPDLETLRRTDEMKALLASPPAPLPRKDRPAGGKVPRR